MGAYVFVPRTPTLAMMDAFAGTRIRDLPTAKQQAELDAYAAMLAAAPSLPAMPDMRLVVELLGFEPDNHHNAAVCPYCCQGAPGYIVGNGQGDKFRFWGDSGPEWTADRQQALRFSRRQDAEAFCRDDEDAWHILPVGHPLTENEIALTPGGLR